MGICHRSKENLENYSKKPTPVGWQVADLDLKITNSTINNITEKCLMLFVDTQCNVSRNEHLLGFAPTIPYKLQSYLDVELSGRSLSPGDCLMISVSIQGFNFTDIIIVCISVWDSSDNNLRDPLEQDIQQALTQLKSKEIQSLCITNFNTELGIPQHIGSKTLCRTILNHSEDLQSVTIRCLSEMEQTAMLDTLKKEQQKREDYQMKESLVGSVISNYY